MSTPADNGSQLEPWFTGRPGTVLLYRVNRRPLTAPTLGADQPLSIMDHLKEALGFGEVIITGRKNKRHWILGNRTILPDDTSLTGQIGWHRPSERSGDKYDPITRQWQDVVESAEKSARAPFAFSVTSRILGVLRHPSFADSTVAHVFETLLREGEARREWPSTEWSVEAILDERDFLDWLHSIQSVEKVTLVAKLPNPDGLADFGPVWSDMEARRARSLKYIMEATNKELGLVGLEEDRRVQAHIAMGRNGFGYVTASGTRQGRGTSYDQREKVARETTEDLPPSWVDAAEVLLRIVKSRKLNRSTRKSASRGERNQA